LAAGRGRGNLIAKNHNQGEHAMPVVDPDPKRLPEILKSIPADTPIVMLNLLRFRNKARYKDGEADYDGREAYRRYSLVAFEKVKGVGGEMLWSGDTLAGVIAPEGERWDEVLLVRYPSIQAFARMLADPEYKQATKHRTAALEEARLICNQEK
jgi:uncharacterized protein (DUF1330 family)